MTLKYIGGTLPKIGVYAIGFGSLTRLPSGSWDLNANTVSSVDIVGTGKEYNYAAEGAGIVAGSIIAGPVGALVGGLVPKAFKDDTVQFRINFRDGNIAHFSGSPREYRSALNASFKGHTAAPTTLASPVPTPAPAGVDTEVVKLRAEVAKLRSELGLATTEVEPEAVTAPAPARAPVDLEGDRRAEDVEAVRRGVGMSPEEKVARRDLPKRTDGIATRLWFEGVAELEYVKAPPTGEDRKARKIREALNAAHRATYKSELSVEKKKIESVIRNLNLPFKEGLLLLTEVGDEFRNRTLR